MVDPADEVTGLVEHFGDAAAVDPVAALLLLIGAGVVGVAMAVTAWLTIGGLLAGPRWG